MPFENLEAIIADIRETFRRLRWNALIHECIDVKRRKKREIPFLLCFYLPNEVDKRRTY